MIKRFFTGLATAGLLVGLLGASAGAALANDSPSTVAIDTTTLTWTGQGSPVNQVCDPSDPGAGGYKNGATAGDYMLWIFATDGGSVSSAPTLTINGTIYGNAYKPAGGDNDYGQPGAWQIVTPAYDPSKITSAYTTFVVATTGEGKWVLTISHGCGDGTHPDGLPLKVIKTADGSYDNTYTWTIAKSVDKTLVQQVGGGSATFNYTVTVTHDGGTISNVKVAGTITVTNPNPESVKIDSVTDSLSDLTDCTVTGGGAQTLPNGDTKFAYSCELSALPTGSLDNTATVSWSDQTLGSGAKLDGSSANFTFVGISFAENKIDECVDVTDSYQGTLGTVCVGGANPATFTYARTVTVPVNDCVSYDNTATFTTNDTGATGSASQTVKVCGPAKTGALTIGFWKTTNGSNLILNYCQPTTGLAPYLKNLGGSVNGPFGTLSATASCKDVNTYVQGVLVGATATDMNRMLKAQMLGTALDVWFSGSGWTSTTVNKIKPPSNFLPTKNLGTFKMDTTAVCPMVDSTTTGTATCKNGNPSTDAVASGAVPSSPMTMQAILDFAAASPSPYNAGVWYGGNRTKQEILKNIFDQFNNQMAFGSF